jgi:hypothetical protein
VKMLVHNPRDHLCERCGVRRRSAIEGEEGFQEGCAMRLTVFGLVILAALGASGARAVLSAAENACKGLATEACTSNNGCSWVKPYKAKSGKEIAGFCRKKPARSPTEKIPDKS